MSDTVLKVVPVDPRHVPAVATQRQALHLLIRFAPKCEDPDIRIHREVQYIDAGENEEGATCPRCGHRLSFDWSPEHEAEMDWYREMVHRTEQSAEGIRTVMPCCRAEIPFEEVRFESSGFGKFEMVISNPDTPHPLSAEAMQQLEAVVGCRLRQVWAYY